VEEPAFVLVVEGPAGLEEEEGLVEEGWLEVDGCWERVGGVYCSRDIVAAVLMGLVV